ncbi:Enoyl-(Acyl carrier protein) reductase, partial [Rhizoctonia solani]
MPVQYIMDHLLRDKLYDVSGRVVLVTGGGTGIGLMITKTLAANGAKVYIGSRRGEKVESTAKETSPQVAGQIIPIELDVTDKTSIKNAVKTISENDGKLDLLVNNAAITGPVSMFFNDPSASENKTPETLGNALFENEKVEDWMGLYGNNVASIFFVTTAFLGLLSKASETRGAWSAGVINISSMSGQLRISENKFAYNSAKAANIQLTKMFATELALKKIPVRINAIAPGVYPSEMTGEQGTHTLPGKEASEIAQGLRPIPFDRSGNDIDMGGLALFLASPAGYYVHGQVITTDGGFTAVHPAVS